MKVSKVDFNRSVIDHGFAGVRHLFSALCYSLYGIRTCFKEETAFR